MKLPSKGSRAEIVLHALYRAPATIAQGLELHANFKIEPHRIRLLYDGLVDNGCAIMIGPVYSISIRARDYLDGCLNLDKSTARGVVAGPAYRPEPKPLKVAPSRLREMRPGAFDYQDMPSRIGDESIPYHTSLPAEA
jgi:hypothetical protein